MAKVTVDLAALRRNAVLLKKECGDFFCVLKCNAYGHGDRECAAALYFAGMRKFAVYGIDEALRIKPFVGLSEILILGRTDPCYAGIISENGFIQSVSDIEYASVLNSCREKINVHVEIETGMNRTGFKVFPEILFAGRFPNLNITGVFTHFPDADLRDVSGVSERFENFANICAGAEESTGRPLIKHCAASAAALRFPEMRMDASRIGLALYGVLPENSRAPALMPVMKVSGRVVAVNMIKKGQTVGYGCVYRCNEDSLILTVDAGYGDGLKRNIFEKFRPLFKGERLPFAGRICMDRCMVDATALYKKGIKAEIGDEVFFISSAEDIEYMSECAGTIGYEILTSFSYARERRYTDY